MVAKFSLISFRILAIIILKLSVVSLSFELIYTFLCFNNLELYLHVGSYH